MEAKIPNAVISSEEKEVLTDCGLKLLSRGKVRDMFGSDYVEQELLILNTDRISIFDFVLAALVPNKGKILNALSTFWFVGPLDEFPSHFLAAGDTLDYHLPKKMLTQDYWLKYLSELRSRLMVVKKHRVAKIECVVRGYLLGSAWDSYQSNRTAFGIRLPKDLVIGSRLPQPIFTPTTKSKAGHDLPLNPRDVQKKFPQLVEKSLQIYEASHQYASEQGIILLDTKYEFSIQPDGSVVLVDEVNTPDSSRFCLKEEWEVSLNAGIAPPSLDKQVVREWGKTIKTPFSDKKGKCLIGIHRLDPANPKHIAFVHSLKVPAAVIRKTAKRYHQIFQRLTGSELKTYLRDELCIYANAHSAR